MSPDVRIHRLIGLNGLTGDEASSYDTNAPGRSQRSPPCGDLGVVDSHQALDDLDELEIEGEILASEGVVSV